ncbi:MAG: hypothetical protein OEZ06_17980 [Myxococcales bacterium]|nr:hypothetical protein [Myxococcales bacterium]
MAEATAASRPDRFAGFKNYLSGQGLLVLLLFGLPVLAVIGHLIVTRTPTPKPKTSVVITRNSLLPHRYAGPCLNCHRIVDVGPVAMNRNNMQLFSLAPTDQRLLLAGQRVDVPSVGQQMRMPAILRSDILPHSYVGVCSNCHIVMDIRPSDQFMQKAMRRAYQPLATMDLSAEQLARGGERKHRERAFYRNLWGYLSLVLFLLSCTYVGMRILMRSYPATFKGKFKLKRWFVIHEWSSVAFTFAAIAHWYYSDRGNNLLHIALLIVIWLTIAGYALRYRLTHKEVQKDVRLLHSQRVLFFTLIGLLVVGHFFAELH